MIRWLQQEDGEGRFKSRFFRNDENEDELIVYANSDNSGFMECAEKCVDAFNNLSKPMVNEICQKLISCAQEGSGLDEEFELPAPIRLFVKRNFLRDGKNQVGKPPWTVRSRFRQRNDNGKNTTRPLTVWIGGTDIEQELLLAGRYATLGSIS